MVKREGMSWVTGVGPKEKERRPRTGGAVKGSVTKRRGVNWRREWVGR